MSYLPGTSGLVPFHRASIVSWPTALEGSSVSQRQSSKPDLGLVYSLMTKPQLLFHDQVHLICQRICQACQVCRP